MTLGAISPRDARQLLQDGAVLVDIRDHDEYAREHIAGAICAPQGELAARHVGSRAGAPVIFHCRSGMRTAAAAGRLTNNLPPSCEGYILEGGIDAWKKMGLPVVADYKRPIEMQRQVQIGAGSLTLAGVLLGFLVSPWFYAISGFVGAGLVTAGVTGFCGMARLLARAPWNNSLRLPPATSGASGES